MTRPDEDTFSLIAELRERGEEFCVVTVVRTEHATSAKAGAKAVVLRDGTIQGFLGGGCVHEVTTPVDVDGTELHRSFCPSGGTVDMFVEPMRRAPRLILCGSSPVAVAVADLGARVGYRIAVAALAGEHQRFATVEQSVTGFDLAPLGIAVSDWIVVSTQGKRDREALAAALASPASYVAFVGSRRKADVLLAQLREQGAISEDRLARLKAPAGLDIHGIEPAEIALSIIAEIVQRRRSGVREEGATAEIVRERTPTPMR
jgi:xanthine dehydrogenase accessory factor